MSGYIPGMKRHDAGCETEAGLLRRYATEGEKRRVKVDFWPPGTSLGIPGSGGLISPEPACADSVLSRSRQGANSVLHL